MTCECNSLLGYWNGVMGITMGILRQEKQFKQYKQMLISWGYIGLIN